MRVYTTECAIFISTDTPTQYDIIKYIKLESEPRFRLFDITDNAALRIHV